MRWSLAVMLACFGLAGCTLPSPFQYKVPDLTPVVPPGNLTADREACNKQYPERIGNYLPHAQCVNTAIEHDSIPFARYPDLVRLQEQLRIKYSTAIDSGTMSPQAAEHQMRVADEIISAAMHDRDIGRQSVADHRVYGLQAMLE
jgi:hypothetical protein